MKHIFFLLIAGCCFLHPKNSKAQTASADNVPTRTTSTKPLASGPSVLGVFEGRPPCSEIARQLKIPVSAECTKLKWGLTLYQDPNSLTPTTYKLEGSLFREKPREGKWAIVKGTKSNPDAVVYQLDPDKPGDSFYLLKGDENVLFILDENRNLRVGNIDFSYTLNRVTN